MLERNGLDKQQNFTSNKLARVRLSNNMYFFPNGRKPKFTVLVSEEKNLVATYC